MQKLEKSVVIRRVRWLLILVSALAASLMLNLVQCAAHDQAASARDAYQNAVFRNWETIDRLEGENASLERRLDEMTETAGAYRSYEVYHDCVQQNLGIYQMEEVARAYERHFRSTELTMRCLAESAWYKTHPHGINPAHLHR